MGAMKPVSFTLHNALTRWQWSPFSLFMLAVLIALACLYLQGDWRLATRGRAWPRRRTYAFIGGLVAVDLAVQSPVATFTGAYFEAHVVQHLLLMVVAPPLLALGAPSTLLLQTASRRVKVRWVAVLRSRPFAVLTHPISVWLLYFGVMFVFFLTSLINTAMHDMALMDVMNLAFLLGGCLYWWPMVGPDPIVHWKMGYGARMLNVLMGVGPETFLGVVILSQRLPIASMYTLSSTHIGGGILWASTDFVTLVGFVPIFLAWMRSEERAATSADARAAKGSEPVRPAARSSNGKQSRPPLSAWEAAWLAKTGSVPDSPAAIGGGEPLTVPTRPDPRPSDAPLGG
jgi:putative membrane protein